MSMGVQQLGLDDHRSDGPAGRTRRGHPEFWALTAER